ncbi:MAG: RDD family protein [Gammaproteobacteria bacterium]
MTKRKTTPAPAAPPYQTAGLLRRLGAILYDSLLLLALLSVATALVLPLTGGEAIAPGNPLYTSYLFFVGFFFFAWFWIHGGQTLGMRAWRIRVQQRNGAPITWGQALLRFLVAIASWLLLGAGFLWALFDKERMTWHDRYSQTVLVVVPKDAE